MRRRHSTSVPAQLVRKTNLYFLPAYRTVLPHRRGIPGARTFAEREESYRAQQGLTAAARITSASAGKCANTITEPSYRPSLPTTSARTHSSVPAEAQARD